MFSGRSFKLFRIFGFDVGAHWSLPLALILAAVTYGGVAGVALSVLLFASILAHEVGHALVARKKGVPIDGIDLHMFGGVAKMSAPPKSPDDEIAIAIAGPLVSLALAAAAFAFGRFVHHGPIVSWLASANLMLGLFNVIPALPMDGGRVLRAFLAKRKGYVNGTRIAVTVARVFAVALGVYAVWSGSFWLVAMAALVWMMGTEELRMAAQHDLLGQMGLTRHMPWNGYDVAARR